MGKFSEALLDAPRPEQAGGKFSSAILGGPQAQPQAPAPTQPVETSVLGDVARGVADTALLGFADEAEAAARSLVGPESFGQELQQARAKQEGAGLGFTAGQLGGMVLPGAGVAGLAARGATTAAKLGRAAIGGSIEGLIGGFGSSEGGLPGEEAGVAGRVPGAAIGAAIGAPLGAGGQVLAGGLSKFAQRKLTRDINRLDPNKVRELQAKAAEQGIQLTPAELTNLPSLKAQQKALGNLPTTSDDLADFYQGRAGGEIEPAVNRFLENVSPVEGAEVSGLQGRVAAQAAMDNVAANRAAQAAPIYKEAFANSEAVNTKSVRDLIKREVSLFPKDGEVAKKLNKARNLLMRSEAVPQRTVRLESGQTIATPTTTTRLVPEDRLEQLHSAKVEISQMIDAVGENRLGPTTKSRLVKVKNALQAELENASSQYGTATNIYADLSPGVQRVREGVVGIIADLTDPNARLAASKLFNPATSGPLATREAKRLIQAADPDAWQALKRSWLEEKWLKAGQETLEGGPRINRGALFRKALLGDQKQKRILKEALEPEEFKALSDISDVLEASGRVKSVGSDTAWNQEVMRAQRQGSTSLLSRAMKLTTPDILKNIAERWDEKRLVDRSEQLVNIITSPNGIEMMRELKRLPARDVFKRSIIAQMLAGGAIAGGSRAASPLEVDIFPSDRDLPAQTEAQQ